MTDVASIDMFRSPDYWQRSHEVAAYWREKTPAHLEILPDGTRVWVVTRYADVVRLLSNEDGRLSKDSQRLTDIIQAQRKANGRDPDLSGMFGRSMLNADGARHRALRSVVANFLTPKRIQAMKPLVTQLITTLLDRLPDNQDPVDLVTALAAPLPQLVSCSMLGVPDQDRPQVTAWTAAMMQEDPNITNPASKALTAYNLELIATKRASPADDVVSALVAADTLDDDELMATIFLLIVAAHETTIGAIANSSAALIGRPELWKAFSTTPGLVPTAVEEALRFDPPVRVATHRCSTEDITLIGDDDHEVVIPAKEIVLLDIESASRDPRQWNNPDEIVLDRQRLRSLTVAFGHGVHYCLGATLGRMETVLSIEELVRRYPRAELAVPLDELPRRAGAAIMHGYSSVLIH